MKEKVYKYLKDRDWFKNLSMDRQGEICCDMASFADGQVVNARMQMLIEDLQRMEVNHRDLLSNNSHLL